MREGGEMRSFILLPVLFMGWAAAVQPGGFDEIHCSVGGQIVADYGDDFMVGMQ